MAMEEIRTCNGTEVAILIMTVLSASCVFQIFT